MDSFTSSTHNQHWQFTPEKLLQLRTKTYQTLPISIGEVGEILNFYELKTKDFSKAFKLSISTQLSAILLLKRFYISHYHDLKLVFLGTLYLCSKVHGYHLTIAEFLEKIPNLNVSEQQVLEVELLVASAVDFELQMHHPLVPLEGIFMKFRMQLLELSVGIIDNDVKQIMNSGTAMVLQSYLTDAPLLYSPALIALTCLSISIQKYPQYTQAFIAFAVFFKKVDIKAMETLEKMILNANTKPDKQKMKEISKLL